MHRARLSGGHPAGAPLLAGGTLLLGMLWIVLGPALAAAGDLRIEAAWARPTPPGIDRTAAYFRIHNMGATEERLLAVGSPMARVAELHETAERDGMMVMQPLALPLTIEPGGTLVLRPGAIHLMLLELDAPIPRGAAVPLMLTFARAGALPVEAEARDTPPAADGAAAGGDGPAGMAHED